MNLFESLQMLDESNTQTINDLVDDICYEIHETFGCDIDDIEYDEKSYPKKFRAQLVVYNMSYESCEEMKKIIKEKLTQYKNVSVNVHSDDKYCGGPINNASVFRIRAHDD